MTIIDINFDMGGHLDGGRLRIPSHEGDEGMKVMRERLQVRLVCRGNKGSLECCE